MQSSFKRNLIISYSISIFLLLVSSVASFISIQNLLSSNAQVNHTNMVIKELEGILTSLKARRLRSAVSCSPTRVNTWLTMAPACGRPWTA